MKKSTELVVVGETTTVTVKEVGPGYTEFEGVEYFVMCEEDIRNTINELLYSKELNSGLDTYFVNKSADRVYSISEKSEFPQVIITRIL